MFNLHRGQLIIATLAQCLAAHAFERVEFVTDSFGVELAERLGWRFTAVVPALDSLDDFKAPHIWAIGKPTALLTQKKAVCQFDLDVLLHKGLSPRMRSGKLIAQSVDWPNWYKSDRIQLAIEMAGLPKGQVAYNAGLLGGADMGLVHDYAKGAVELAHKFVGREQELNEGTSISMVCEQYWLGVFAREAGVRIETILPLNPTREQWHEVGYTHLHGDAKRDAHYIRKASERLERDFPDAAKAFEAGWRELEFDYLE